MTSTSTVCGHARAHLHRGDALQGRAPGTRCRRVHRDERTSGGHGRGVADGLLGNGGQPGRPCRSSTFARPASYSSTRVPRPTTTSSTTTTEQRRGQPPAPVARRERTPGAPATCRATGDGPAPAPAGEAPGPHRARPHRTSRGRVGSSWGETGVGGTGLPARAGRPSAADRRTTRRRCPRARRGRDRRAPSPTRRRRPRAPGPAGRRRAGARAASPHDPRCAVPGRPHPRGHGCDPSGRDARSSSRSTSGPRTVTSPAPIVSTRSPGRAMPASTAGTSAHRGT